MSRVVVDASTAIAWLLEESRPSWVDELLADVVQNRKRLIAPSIFWLEVSNTLVRARALSDEQAIDGMLRLESFGIETISLDRPLRMRSLLLARELGLTMYDATYMVVADTMTAPLATLDRRLDSAAAARGLSFGTEPRRVSEQQTAYSQNPDPVSLAAIGAAIAELRSRDPSRVETDELNADLDATKRAAKRYRGALRELAR